MPLARRAGTDLFPILTWTPDGQSVTYNIEAEAGSHEVVMIATPADTSGRSVQLLQSDDIIAPTSWSATSGVLAYYQIADETARDLWTLDPATASGPTPFLVTPYNERAAHFSPDGRWLAYVSDESGRDEVYVRPYPGPGSLTPISTEGGAAPVWSPTGAELFYRQGTRMMAVAVETTSGLTVGSTSVLFNGPYRVEALTGVPNYDVAQMANSF